MNYFKLLWELRSLKNNTKKTRKQMQDLQKEKLSNIPVSYTHLFMSFICLLVIRMYLI